MSLRVTQEQLPYVADHQPVAAIALAKAHVGAMDHVWSPLLILNAATPVGFLALTHPQTDPGHTWLFHFFIDHRHQRQGHARAAMAAILARLRTRTPPAARLSLLVNPANTPAHALYCAAGLAFTGAEADGDLVMSRDLA